MGYPTDFIGHVDIEPPLNPAEVAYLTDLGAAPPRAGDRARVDGRPDSWCDWVPCWDGCCLAYDGVERFHSAARWLRFLVDHLLRPGAVASRTGRPELAGFTFDHVLDGMVVGCRRDNKELFAVTVRENRVREEVLRRADRRFLGRPPLPYERAADDDPVRRLRREQRGGQVLPLTRRPSA